MSGSTVREDIIDSLLDHMFDPDEMWDSHGKFNYDNDETLKRLSLIQTGSRILEYVPSLQNDAKPLIELIYDVGDGWNVTDWSFLTGSALTAKLLDHHHRTARDILFAALEEVARKHPAALEGNTNHWWNLRNEIDHLVDRFLYRDYSDGHILIYQEEEDPLRELIETIASPKLLDTVFFCVIKNDPDDEREIIRGYLRFVERKSGVTEAKNHIAKLRSWNPSSEEEIINAIRRIAPQYI